MSKMSKLSELKRQYVRGYLTEKEYGDLLYEDLGMHIFTCGLESAVGWGFVKEGSLEYNLLKDRLIEEEREFNEWCKAQTVVGVGVKANGELIYDV